MEGEEEEEGTDALFWTELDSNPPAKLPNLCSLSPTSAVPQYGGRCRLTCRSDYRVTRVRGRGAGLPEGVGEASAQVVA